MNFIEDCCKDLNDLLGFPVGGVKLLILVECIPVKNFVPSGHNKGGT